MGKDKNQRGITLISLIVTIIVLLILTGISVNKIVGDNSLIDQTANAKDGSIQQKEEEVILAAYHKALGMSKYGDAEASEIENAIKKLGYDVRATNVIDGIQVVFEGTNDIYVINHAGTISRIDSEMEQIVPDNPNTENPDPENPDPNNPNPENPDPVIPEILAAGTPMTNPSTYGPNAQATADGTGKFFAKPTGAEYVEGTVDTGVVIRYKNSEFVWVPVATAVAAQEADGTDNKAMAIKIGNDYRGLLYNFSWKSSTVKEGCTTTTTNFREPSLVTGYPLCKATSW